ncbi:hypothetical protein KIPB_011292 [Kipferlia bialata]|uniref:Uncharacterized protein n=1 Tax=Kipferlia bialata TaxID=797122 RepID=A0A9K3D4Y4_9EUKA|nr:hypothetical protein KIPB_011292 [Kipferlia bialata]|eukprot:g11292.t1
MDMYDSDDEASDLNPFHVPLMQRPHSVGSIIPPSAMQNLILTLRMTSSPSHATMFPRPETPVPRACSPLSSDEDECGPSIISPMSECYSDLRPVWSAVPSGRVPGRGRSRETILRGHRHNQQFEVLGGGSAPVTPREGAVGRASVDMDSVSSRPPSGLGDYATEDHRTPVTVVNIGMMPPEGDTPILSARAPFRPRQARNVRRPSAIGQIKLSPGQRLPSKQYGRDMR